MSMTWWASWNVRMMTAPVGSVVGSDNVCGCSWSRSRSVGHGGDGPGLAARAEDVDTTVRPLVIHRFVAKDQLDAALEQVPLLRGYAYSGELIRLIAKFGRLNVYEPVRSQCCG
jgi:hypothetical protein